MMKKISLIGICWMVLSTGHLFAQEVYRFSLKECVDYALTQNITIKQSELNVINSQIDYQQAKWNRYPNLTANTALTNSVGRTIDPFTNLIIDQGVNSQSLGANSSMTIFNGLALTNTIKQSRVNFQKSEYDYEEARNNTTLTIINSYINILLAEEQLKSALINLETSQLQEERTQKQVNAGALPIQNLLQIKQQRANDELVLIRAENGLELAKLNLKQGLQIPGNAELEIVVPSLDDPTQLVLSETADGVYQYAEKTQPSIKSAEASVESAEYGVSIARANRLPTLSLFGGISSNYSSAAPDQFPDPNSPTGFRENTYFNQLDFNLRRFAQLSLNIPIFSRMQNTNSVSKSKITQENARYQLINSKMQLRQTIEQAYQEARAAGKSYEATLKQVEALRESFRNAEQRFNLGAADPVEYNQIKNSFNGAEFDLIRAKYDFIFKLKVLDFYSGKPIDL
jgi:outer membrane protein